MIDGHNCQQTRKLSSCRSPIIVMGMHRSGTSMLAEILSGLGIYMGADLSANYESRAFQRINRRLLQDQGAHWANPDAFLAQLHDKSFIRTNARKVLDLLEHEVENYGDIAQIQRWGWKDPRNTITLPVWLSIFPEARVIHVVRNGIAVALSLHRREIGRYFRRTADKRMFPPSIVAGYRLWQQYVQAGLAQGANCRHFMQLRYEDVYQQPGKEISELCQALRVRSSPDLVAKLGGLVKKSTRPSRFDNLHVNILLWLGLLDPRLLIALGYELKASWTHEKPF